MISQNLDEKFNFQLFGSKLYYLIRMIKITMLKVIFCDRISDRFLSKLRPNFRFLTNFLTEMGRSKTMGQNSFYDWSITNCYRLLWLTDIRSKYFSTILCRKNRWQIFPTDGRTRSQNTVMTKLRPTKVGHKKFLIDILTYFSITKASQFGLVNWNL